eukprot:symbB.v1.2.014939.t1/scaffold1102.1/size137770/5
MCEGRATDCSSDASQHQGHRDGVSKYQLEKECDGCSQDGGAESTDDASESERMSDSPVANLTPNNQDHHPEVNASLELKCRRVSFDLKACEVHDVIAYSDIYGVHPRDFVFGKDYSLMPAFHHIPMDVLAAKACAERKMAAFGEMVFEQEIESGDGDSDSDFEAA